MGPPMSEATALPTVPQDIFIICEQINLFLINRQ